jgi:hypothetical protein
LMLLDALKERNDKPQIFLGKIIGHALGVEMDVGFGLTDRKGVSKRNVLNGFLEQVEEMIRFFARNAEYRPYIEGKIKGYEYDEQQAAAYKAAQREESITRMRIGREKKRAAKHAQALASAIAPIPTPSPAPQERKAATPAKTRKAAELAAA